MFLKSEIGKPFYNFSLEKQEWKKGEKLGGFTLPFNVFDSTDGLFRRFGLWQSSNGVCVQGVDHKPFKVGKFTMRTTSPVLTGDRVFGKTVVYSECDFLDRFNLWQCRVEYGDLPDPKSKESEIELLNEYVKSDNELANLMVDLVSDFFEKILPVCVCPPGGGNVETTLAKPIFEIIEQKAKKDIEEKIRDLKSKLWH